MDNDVELKQRKEIIEKAIMKLPEASRIVLILREFQEMSYQEIAETLEIPIGTVMSRLNYARKNLFSCIVAFTGGNMKEHYDQWLGAYLDGELSESKP